MSQARLPDPPSDPGQRSGEVNDQQSSATDDQRLRAVDNLQSSAAEDQRSEAVNDQQSSAASDQQSGATMRALALLVARTASWVYEVGTWIFGGLIGFSLLLISALLTVGPVDTAILVSVLTLGCALPLDVAAISVLRLAKDSREVGMWIDELTLGSFKDAGFPDIESYFPPASERESGRQKRAMMTIAFAAGIAPLSIALSFIGLVAALWYMAWWIGVTVLSVSVASTALVVVTFVRMQPPETEAEKELKRRYAESEAAKALKRSYEDSGGWPAA